MAVSRLLEPIRTEFPKSRRFWTTGKGATKPLMKSTRHTFMQSQSRRFLAVVSL
jgi:hypothetical protein